MARRKVFLHIGLAGTGAGFVEQALLTHAEALESAGVDVPWRSSEELLRAVVEIRRTHKAWGYERAEVEGTWATLCRRVFKLRGTAVISQDLLAMADHDQAALLLDGLSGREVHLVLTVRDPAIQIAHGWGEAIRSGESVSFGRFRRRVLDPTREHDHAQEFWAAQDLGAVLDRWGPLVKAERVHVVVVPGGGDPRPSIWRELAELVGFDADAFPGTVARAAQPTLGATEAAVLRGVNRAIDGRIEGQLRRAVVKRYFADRVLGGTDDPPPPLPPEDLEVLVKLAESWQKQIANDGYDVRGEVADLIPLAPAKATLSPDEVPAKERLKTTTDALADVLVEVARLREHNERLEIRNTKLVKKRKKLKRKLAETKLDA
jgi:hypothetical protein